MSASLVGSEMCIRDRPALGIACAGARLRLCSPDLRNGLGAFLKTKAVFQTRRPSPELPMCERREEASPLGTSVAPSSTHGHTRCH
eukprot:15357377-Alexandrium_andersonii.AAC.1